MAELRVALRLDVAPAIGMGHLKRAMDLAQALRTRKIEYVFACPQDAHTRLHGEGISADKIVASDPDGVWLDRHQPSHIITDIMWSGNAQAAAHEIATLTARNACVAVIDSMPPDHFVTQAGSRPPACVVTPYLDAETLRTPPEAVDWAAGADFAIMDASYETARANINRNAPLPQRILVSCGGSDPTGLSLRIAQALITTGYPIDLVIGPMYAPALQTALAALAATHPQLAVHRPQPGLVQMIERAGIVVGRIGLLRYQAAALGRHGIYLFEGPEYRAYLENFSARGVAEVFFADPPDGDHGFLARLAQLRTDQTGLLMPNLTAMDAVHGNGATNVIDRVLTQRQDTP